MKDRPRRILVVDDDDQICECVTALLMAHGFWVRASRSLNGALALLRIYRFDATILDLRFPDHTPHDTLDTILEMKERGAGRVVIISGMPLPDEWRGLARANGADDFVEKVMPEFPERLLRAIGFDKTNGKSDSPTQRVSIR